MHDLLIKNGTVIDGTGAPRRRADVAVVGGKIAAVGATLGPARREIEAEGLLVTPGFVDIHSHYDGQATWDPLLTSSCWHGVTTTIFGNCGVGFAPVRRGSERYLINLMEGVEDIPETVLAEGVKFNWTSFSDYLDAVAATPRVMDVGAQMPHAALRFYAMGERGADHRAVPSEDEIARMGALLEEALHAGALGFSTSRTVKHRARDGRPTPSLSAGEAELFGLARALQRAGRGVLEVNSDFAPGEFAILRQAAAIAARPLSCLLLQVDDAPARWRETLAQIKAARAQGIAAVGQVGSRPIGVLMGLETSLHPFIAHAAWRELGALSPRERYERLLQDDGLRQRLVTERPRNGLPPMIARAIERAFPLREPLDYEPAPERSIMAQARAQGRDVLAVALEAMLAEDGKGLLLHPFENYTDGDLEVLREMLVDEATVMGLGDGGAHVGLICDASGPTSLLTHWARDRRRGPQIALEFLVEKQTRRSAASYGLDDRGVLAPGWKADINIIDFAALKLKRPEIVYDLPAGGKRLIQRAEGYRHTFVSGIETMRDGEPTGALPGVLVRGPQSAA